MSEVDSAIIPTLLSQAFHVGEANLIPLLSQESCPLKGRRGLSSHAQPLGAWASRPRHTAKAYIPQTLWHYITIFYAERTAPSPLRGTPPNLGGELRLLSSTGSPLIGAVFMHPFLCRGFTLCKPAVLRGFWLH